MNYSLSETDLRKYLGKNLTIKRYSDLVNIKDIDQYMADKPFIIILYRSHESYGHWTCLLKHDKFNSYEFFDSYGIKPDRQLISMPLRIRNAFGQESPILAALLFDSKRNIEYNNFRLQKVDDKIATCGKWVTMRCLMNEIPIEVFGQLFSNNKKPADRYLESLWKTFVDRLNNK